MDERFDEAAYLAAHADVREAVRAGHFASGQAHWEAFGRGEGRALGLRVARNAAELDAEIGRLRGLMQHSFSAWLRGRATFTYAEDVAALPADPLSPAYREAQLALYRTISGAARYDPWEAEPYAVAIGPTLDPRPYPFNTGDGDLIAGHLRAVAAIVEALWRQQPGAGLSVLEYGCGEGCTTLLLGASGYRMTAVDINAGSLSVLERIAAGRGLAVRTFNGTFGQAPDENERFDIVLFYEAFHHCLEFVPLLETLHRRLRQGGLVLFAGEPIFADFPKPWGLRLDGASLWEIRTRGWLELGFREEFFRDVLARTGWTVEKLAAPGTPDLFVCRSRRAAE